MTFWVEGLAFRFFGSTPQTAVFVARCWASLALLLAGLAGRWASRFGEPPAWATGAWCMIGLATFPGFLHESQVPVIEMPLTAAAAGGLAALTALDHRPRAAMVGFGLAMAAGFLMKGPPILALLVPLGLLVVLR